MKLGSPNLSHDESWNLILFLSIKVKGQGHESQKHCRRGSLHSCECWLFLVIGLIITSAVQKVGRYNSRQDTVS